MLVGSQPCTRLLTPYRYVICCKKIIGASSCWICWALAYAALRVASSSVVRPMVACLLNSGLFQRDQILPVSELKCVENVLSGSNNSLDIPMSWIGARFFAWTPV